MKQNTFTILSNDALTPNVFSMWLSGDTTDIHAGQFVNIEVPNWYLRRPISVCEVSPVVETRDSHVSSKDPAVETRRWCVSQQADSTTLPHEEGLGRLRLVYKVVGTGTKDLSLLQAGEQLSVLTALGNGYDLTKAGTHPLLIGGGIGVPPLLQLAKDLRAQNKEVTVVLGFNTASEVILEDDFKALGCNLHICTMNGTYGTKGTVVDVLCLSVSEAHLQIVRSDSEDKNGPLSFSEAVPAAGGTYFYTCGPIPMLKALHKALPIDGEFSLEERMGCGFGACMGCTLETKSGHKRVCKEGPVFLKSELFW